jgi:antitoxin (DNA-binding transcriptional repressor) of toxin-antitoxin stability system
MGTPKKPRRSIKPGSTTITVTEAARSFADIVNRAFYRGEHFILTKGGRSVVELSPLPGLPVVTAAGLRRFLRDLPHLDRAEADAFGQDIEAARSAIPSVGDDPWES